MSGVHAENLPLVEVDGLSVMGPGKFHIGFSISRMHWKSKPFSQTVSIGYLLNKILIDYVELI